MTTLRAFEKTLRIGGLVLLATVLATAPASAQQTGSISGKVSSPDGDGLPGVTVTASGDVLPQARTTVTNTNGVYSLSLLPPGNYSITYELDGLATVERTLKVLLQQNTRVDVTMTAEGVTETVQVIGAAELIDTTSAELKAAIDDETIDKVPVGQQYRDLVKLIPGVQYTEDSVRGPSAGGNGQDNVYLFDGVSVGLPLFGTLAAEPSSHDVEQIAVVKGGAKAQDFNRSGGFTINTISKSGTNRFSGDVSYQLQNESMTGSRDVESESQFDQDEDWAVASIGGPLVRERLFFYASYFRPTIDRNNRSNLYGDVPNFSSERDELFGKLSFQPTSSLLLHGSYRDSTREDRGSGVTSESTAGTASSGGDTDQTVAIFEGSWIVNNSSFLSFKYNDYELLTSGRPDSLLGFDIYDDGRIGLDTGNLDRMGLFQVPQPVAGQDAYNAFIAPLIDRYGYLENGARVGGGLVGVDSTINDQDFFRESYQAAYDFTVGTNVTHDFHIGYQYEEASEDLSRGSNGWGLISVIGGRDTASNGQPIFYEARFQQQSLLSAGGAVVPSIASAFETQSIELNDTISLDNWTFNVGVMFSKDELFGEGLRENPNNVSGFELAVGNRYKMYEVDFEDMIQPRLGAIWSPNGTDTVYANYALYYPAASSLPRAASWARNLRSEIRGYFDAGGNLIETTPVSSSSGKFFQPNMDPRSVEEFVLGYSRQINRSLTGKVHARYRYGSDFWEDTNNSARGDYNPPAGIPTEDYIPELGTYRDEVGGSSYVIAQLDGAFTKYYEAGVEANYRKGNANVTGSYVWSHYYGNFDQDNTTTENDDAIFLGSSFIADGAGRQLWDNRYGDLRGDRRHMLKLFGFYDFEWNGSAGAYAVYQSGQPWEAWNVEVYRNLTGSSSDTSRYAEPAGSRTTDDHWQIDLNYTHNFPFGERYNVQLTADVYNVFDEQTGYNIQNKVNSSGFGTPRSYYRPRRLQLAVKFQF